MSQGKILRWAMNLKDAQVSDLVMRLAQTAQRVGLQAPGPLRQTIVDFVKGIPYDKA